MSLMGNVLDHLLGPSIERIPTAPEKTLYLTFDDGPHPYCTEAVLKVLNQHKVRATFFLVAERAQQNTSLVHSIQAEAHTFGNHSLDHRYDIFFSKKEQLKAWIEKAHNILTHLTGSPLVGFRSPAGVRTPRLHWALKQLDIPLIHWAIRFYDTRIPWTPSRSSASFQQTLPGSIVLLHDSHSEENAPIFLHTLTHYIQLAKEKGFQFRAIHPTNISH